MTTATAIPPVRVEARRPDGWLRVYLPVAAAVVAAATVLVARRVPDPPAEVVVWLLAASLGIAVLGVWRPVVAVVLAPVLVLGAVFLASAPDAAAWAQNVDPLVRVAMAGSTPFSILWYVLGIRALVRWRRRRRAARAGHGASAVFE